MTGSTAPTTEVREALRTQREALGWSQRYLAERMGTTQSHVSEMESGRADAGPDVLARWADALGLDVIVTVTLHDRTGELWPESFTAWPRSG